MTKPTFSTIISVQGAQRFLSRGLEIAQALGLPVTSWRAGDPTRSLYHYLADVLGTLEGVMLEYIRAGVLDESRGDWLKLRASEIYGVEAGEAIPATPTVTIRNTGAAFYSLAAGDLTVGVSTSGVTFHSTVEATFTPGTTLALAFEADTPGADGSVIANEIDDLVTAFPGLEIVSSTAAVGVDATSEEDLRAQCLASRGALSPNGPSDAYEYVARNSELTGIVGVTRVHATLTSSNGTVAVYVANASGTPLTAPDLAAVQAAISEYAEPLTALATVQNAITSAITVTGTAYGALPVDFEARIESAIVAYFSTLIGPVTVARSKLNQIAHEAVPALDRIVLSSPNSDLTLTAGVIPVLASCTITEGA